MEIAPSDNCHARRGKRRHRNELAPTRTETIAMADHNNVFRQKLDAGEPTIGCRVSSVWAGIAETIGWTGQIDYVEFVSEYGPFDNFALENFARAIDLFPHMSSLIKMDQMPRPYLAIRAAGAGIENFLFSDVRGVEDAREAVASVRADAAGQTGLRGMGATRDNRWGYGFDVAGYVEKTNQAVVMIMVEKKACVDDLEAVLTVPGLDMTQFGPTDFSMNSGNYAGRSSDAVKKAELYSIETSMKMGVTPRVEISTPQAAAPYLEMGIRHFSLSGDMYVLRDFWATEGKALRDMIEAA